MLFSALLTLWQWQFQYPEVAFSGHHTRASYPLQAGVHPCLTITLTPLTGGMHIRTATGKGPSVLSSARILQEAEACDSLHPWHSVIFLPLPSLSPKAWRNRLTIAC